MWKLLLLIPSMTILVTSRAWGLESDFEDELRRLETNQLQTEELQMRNADAVTGVIADEVATGQAAIKKGPAKEEQVISERLPETLPENTKRVRRVRSR